MGIFDKIIQSVRKAQFIVENRLFGFENFNSAVVVHFINHVNNNHVDVQGAKEILEKIEKIGGKDLLREILLSNDSNVLSVACHWSNHQVAEFILDKAEHAGGPGFVKQVLQNKDYNPLMHAAQQGNAPTIKVLLDKADKVGGPEFLKEIFVYSNFAFSDNANNFGQKGHVDYVNIMFDKAEKAGFLREMLSNNGYRNLFDPIRTGDLKVALAIYDHAAKLGPEFLTDMLKNILGKLGNRSTDNRGKEEVLNIYARPSFPLELRSEFTKTPLGKKILLECDQFISTKNLPSLNPENLGKEGGDNKYASALLATSKFVQLQSYLDTTKLDFKKIISNYKAGDAKLINWGAVADRDKTITFDAIKQVRDIREIAKYTACNLLAHKFADEGRLDLVSGILDNPGGMVAQLTERILKYSFEEKTLVQISKISEQWHSHRAHFVKSNDNKKEHKTLRDFAEEGTWHQTTKNAITPVTDKGLSGYTIVNLTTAQELDIEGSILDHCSSSYVGKCKTEGYQVFSVRHNGEPISTIGYKVVNGNLQFDQHYGYDNAPVMPNSNEAKARKWFEDNLNSSDIQINLTKVGRVESISQYSHFENIIGMKIDNMTPDRLQANMDLMTSFAKQNINDPKRDIYIYGKDNVKAPIAELAKTLGIESTLDVIFDYVRDHVKPVPRVVQEEVKEAARVDVKVEQAKQGANRFSMSS